MLIELWWRLIVISRLHSNYDFGRSGNSSGCGSSCSRIIDLCVAIMHLPFGLVDSVTIGKWKCVPEILLSLQTSQKITRYGQVGDPASGLLAESQLKRGALYAAVVVVVDPPLDKRQPNHPVVAFVRHHPRFEAALQETICLFNRTLALAVASPMQMIIVVSTKNDHFSSEQ